jgi:hypothetical protein
MSFYSILVLSHSVVRWLLLVLMVVSIFIAIAGYLKGKELPRMHAVLFSVTSETSHLQLLLGFILYFISPKVIFSAEAMKYPASRFFTAEHILMMVVAITLITIGSIFYRKTATPRVAYRRILIYFGLALLLILAAIPWGRF